MPERILTILKTNKHSENKLRAIMDIIHENEKSAYKWCDDCANTKETQKELGYNMFTDVTPYF